jgi:hypothetical protein
LRDDLNETILPKQRGRGSKEKNKNSLIDNQIHATRSSHDTLTKPTDFGKSPFSEVKREHKKQQNLQKYFKNKQQQII